jgi:hypothetical protein
LYTIDEVEYYAEQYQMKKKYGEGSQVLSELELRSESFVEESHQLAEQIKDMS